MDNDLLFNNDDDDDEDFNTNGTDFDSITDILLKTNNYDKNTNLKNTKNNHKNTNNNDQNTNNNHKNTNNNHKNAHNNQDISHYSDEQNEPSTVDFSMYEFGAKVYGHLSHGFRFAGTRNHARLEGLIYHDKILSSAYISARVSSNCMIISASYINTTTLEVISKVELKRNLGSQCHPGEIVDCRVRFGKGKRVCEYGYWRSECLVVECYSGYELRMNKVFRRPECVSKSEKYSGGNT